MRWSVERRRGAGFTVYPLHLLGAQSILTSLYRHPRLTRTDLMRILTAAAKADEPVVGVRDLPGGIATVLPRLVDAGLVVRCVRGGPGCPSRYEATGLGAALVEHLAPLTGWGLRWFDALAGFERRVRGLPPLARLVPDELRRPGLATGMAVGLLSPRWALVLLMYIDSAGQDGIGPARLQARVNSVLESSSGASRVAYRLTAESMHRTLPRLVDAGLLQRYPAPPQVMYRLTLMGADLMAALWEVSRWGMEHDAELFAMMVRISGWFPNASAD